MLGHGPVYMIGAPRLDLGRLFDGNMAQSEAHIYIYLLAGIKDIVRIKISLVS